MEKCNFIEAKKFLTRFCTDVEEIERFFNKKEVCKVKTLSEYETVLKENLEIAYKEIVDKNLYVMEDENTLAILRNSLVCLMFNEKHDLIMPFVHEMHKREDERLFRKCRSLCEKKVTVDQMGAPENHSIQFLAAIVELASLNSHKSPMEKLNCLQTAFDMIFAELKAALIENISKFSDKENDIPVINNEDIVPVLMLVITKSKPTHFYSNLYYVEKFQWSINTNNDTSNLIGMYKNALKRLVNLHELKTASPDTLQDLDVTTFMTISTEVETSKHFNKDSLLYQQKERIVNLIMASTNN